MAKALSNKAHLLLDAHIQFVMDQLGGPALRGLVEREVHALLNQVGRVPLEEVVTRETIKDTVRTYAVELELGGGIPELVGDIARAIYAHEAHDNTTLQDLMPDEQFRDWLDKALEMRALREKLVRDAVSNPVYAALASDLLYHGIRGYLAENPLTRGVPGARSMMKLGKAMMARTPGLEASLEEGLKKYIGRSIELTLKESERFLIQHFDDERLRELVLETWDRLKPEKAALFREYLGSLDVEEFFVTGYEYWRHLRKTAWFSELVNNGIDVFFDKYSATPLRELLDEVGIGEEVLVAEAMRFAPPVLEALKTKKLLEPIVRRNLEGFYASPTAAAILKA